MNSELEESSVGRALPQEHEDLPLRPSMYNRPASMAPGTAVLSAGKAVTGRSPRFTGHPAQPHWWGEGRESPWMPLVLVSNPNPLSVWGCLPWKAGFKVSIQNNGFRYSFQAYASFYRQLRYCLSTPISQTTSLIISMAASPQLLDDTNHSGLL